jgi:predicted flap endonuclease-1-like 5' DNA nuclease
VNGFTLLVLIVLAAAIPLAFRAGVLRERRDARMRAAPPFSRRAERDDAAADAAADSAAKTPGDAAAATPSAAVPATSPAADVTVRATADTSAPRHAMAAAPRRAMAATPAASPDGEAVPAGSPCDRDAADLVAERARIIRVAERESAALRAHAGDAEAELGQLRDFADDRRRLLRALADAQGETARYREIVVDLEDGAAPPLLGVAGAPDDLKLIVGVGPVLERMLLRMGIATYREIARWSDHDIDTVDARLPEFHGRIRRDGWVTQARALHQGKYGERP